VKVSLLQVAEYGGNLHGYGSKSVLGSGWPKEVLKVEGDTVTLSFEMRSGREHNTPDRALWGFKVKKEAVVFTVSISSQFPSFRRI
jgi:E3 ubiquitin-protein ligase HECTD4